MGSHMLFSSNCNLNGFCNLTEEVCNCKTDYYSSDCSVFCQPQTTCPEGNFVCNNSGGCICEEDYYTSNCSVFCQPQTTCHDHGECSLIGDCICGESSFWSVVEYTSTDCNMQINLWAILLYSFIAIGASILFFTILGVVIFFKFRKKKLCSCSNRSF